MRNTRVELMEIRHKYHEEHSQNIRQNIYEIL